MCDSQRLFHPQYKNRIYAEVVIVSESWALARMTAQAAQSCAETNLQVHEKL